MIPIEKRMELLKVIAHPVRIKILEDLMQGVKCVSDFEESLDISQPNVSQHLSLLRTNGIIDFFIDGRLKCYFLTEPLIRSRKANLRQVSIPCLLMTLLGVFFGGIALNLTSCVYPLIPITASYFDGRSEVGAR